MNTIQLEDRSIAQVKPILSQASGGNSAKNLISYGINTEIRGKEGAAKLSYAGAFVRHQGSIEDLARHIAKGYPWMPAILDDGKPRKKEFANLSHLVALDIDGGMSIEEAMSDSFIQEYCCLGIESSSSTAETPKFRLIFRYSSPIESWEKIESAQQYLMSFVPQADQACKDASRFFFGAEGRQPFLKNDEAVLSPDFLEEASAWKEIQLSHEEIKQANLTQSQFEFGGNSDVETVREALRFIPGRGTPGDNRYWECMKILVCLKARFGEAKALELAEEWSPSDNKDWNISKRLPTFKAESKGSEIGFIVNVAKKYGYKPKRIKSTGEQFSKDLEELAKANYKEFKQRSLAALEQIPSEYRSIFGKGIVETGIKHLTKFQVLELSKAVELETGGIELDEYLKVIASETVNSLRDRKEVSELIQLNGYYIWLSLEDDKIYYDHLKLLKVFGDRLKFNEIKKQVEIDGEPCEVGTAKAKLSINFNFQAKSKTEFSDIFVLTAREHSYNPIVEYLNEVHQKYGSNTDILKGLAKRYLGQEEEIYNTMLVKTLIGAVARAMQPGCKMDTALILQGKQGYRKSTFFKVLAGGDEYFEDSFSSVGGKDEIMKIHQAWIAEMAELETVFRRKEVAAVKAFLSCTTDNMRPPYGRDLIAMPRGGVIVGTTNESEFLSDSTGSRRFWIVPVLQSIPIDTLQEERDQIWAAAVELYQQGQQWWLEEEEETQAAQLNEDFQTSDPWEEMTLRYIDDKEFFTIAEILNQLGLEISRQDKASQNRLAGILKQAGCIKAKKTVGGKQIKGWKNPAPSEERSIQDPNHLNAAEELFF